MSSFLLRGIHVSKMRSKRFTCSRYPRSPLSKYSSPLLVLCAFLRYIYIIYISVCLRMGDTQIYDSFLFWWERDEKPWNLGATLLGGKTWGHYGIWNQPLGCFTAVTMLVVSFYYWNPTPQLSSIKQQISQIYSPEKQTKKQTNKTASIKVMKMAWQAGNCPSDQKQQLAHLLLLALFQRGQMRLGWFSPVAYSAKHDPKWLLQVV